MPRIIKNTLLQYLPDVFDVENIVNVNRIFKIKNLPTKSGKIIYLCERELRVKDNFALQLAKSISEETNSHLKIIHPFIKYDWEPKSNFINKQILQVKKQFGKFGFDFEIYYDDIQEYLKNLNIAVLIVDFNPIFNRNYLKNLHCRIYEIDGHNIIPARFISNKQEYNASTFRRKVYYNIYPFLTEYNNNNLYFKNEADIALESFIKNKLKYYAELKNNPNANVLSDLSKYLNLGFISSQRVCLEVIKSNVQSENKEAFLEELIVRKELADNFCLYSKNFKNLSSVPDWAKMSLKLHKYDYKPYIYSINQLEKMKTHDSLWNSTQSQLMSEGKIHGYLRMYWAKKISEWSLSPDDALNTAIYLNDKYAFDAPSPNGYTGILWAIGGLHDRAFKDCQITGKIRRMTSNSIQAKYNLSEYLKKYY